MQKQEYMDNIFSLAMALFEYLFCLTHDCISYNVNMFHTMLSFSILKFNAFKTRPRTNEMHI